VSKGNRKRRPPRRGSAAARREPPATSTRTSSATSSASTGYRALPDELLPPWERGPVRAFVRDAVDARGPRPMLLFMPAFAVALITYFGPQSDLGHTLLLVSLAALAVVAVDALLLGFSLVRAARQAFPGERVNGVATGWYVFMRAHRPRSMRRPPPA
jgi:hypothetical protein